MSEVLRGFTIGVTAHRRSEEQISLLAGRGAHCIHGPTLRMHTLGAEGEIATATDALLADPPDAVVALTGIGMRGWFEAAEARGKAEELRRVVNTSRVLVRGPKAHGAAITAELDVDWCAPSATTGEMVEHIVATMQPGARIGIQNDGTDESLIGAALQAAGFDVVVVPVYRWSLPDDVGPAEVLVRAIVEGRTDAVTFTARPQVENLLQIAASIDLVDPMIEAFRSNVLPVCVGPVCAATARDAGFGDVLEPRRPRLGAMVQELTDALVAMVVPFRLASQELELRGRTVTGDGSCVHLTGRERDTLTALLERPGVVRSKDHLLRTVWGEPDGDPHVVEVTVGRLRRRLGPAGVGIETVMRRGYRASPE